MAEVTGTLDLGPRRFSEPLLSASLSADCFRLPEDTEDQMDGAALDDDGASVMWGPVDEGRGEIDEDEGGAATDDEAANEDKRGTNDEAAGGTGDNSGGGDDNGRDIGDGDQEVTDDKEGVGLDEVGCADDDSDPDKGRARNDGKAGVVGGFESKGDIT
jgi:hypothetical protein